MSTPVADMAPIPGDVAGIRRHAAKLTRASEAIAGAILLIRGVKDAAASEQSDAVDALAEKIENVQERLSDVRGRYETAGSELTAFADVLESAQATADNAVVARDSAVPDAARLERDLHDARDQVAAATDDATRQDAQRRATAIAQHLGEVERGLDDAQRRHYAAVQSVRDAGDVAAERLAGVIGGDGLNDSWWDNFMGWVSDNAGWLTTLKNILGALTAVIGIISIFFPLLAPVAFALGALTALVSFSLAAAGEGSWLDFGLDMLGVLTFGVGAIAARGVSLGLRGMQTMRGLTYNRQITSVIQRITRPIATRRDAIRLVGDSFQEALPAGETLLTRTPGVFRRAWMEASGVGVEQFKTITQATTLGQSSMRSAFVEGLAEVAVSGYTATQRVGVTLDAAGLTGLALESWNNADVDVDVPVLDQVASVWGDVQSATTTPMSSPTWHPHPGAP